MILPESWTLTTLGECQGKPRTINPNAFTEEMFDLYSVPSYTIKEPDVILGAQIGSTKQLVQPDDVLLCKIVPHIRRGWTVSAERGRRQIASGEWIVLRDHGLRSVFLQRYILADEFHKQFMATVAGVGGSLMRARPVEAGKIPIPVPPLAEQGRIVAKLDALISRITVARTELEHVRKLAKRNRQATLEQVFSTLGDVRYVRVEDLCKVGTGGTPKRSEAKYYSGGMIPWVTSKEVNKGVVERPTALITQAAIDETNCKVYPAGSLIMALYGEGKTRGKVATLGISAATNQALAVLHDFDLNRVTVPWIKFFLEARYEITREEAAGGVQPNLNLGVVKEIEIPTPPISEQERAISQLKANFAHADCLEAEATRAARLLDRLEASIFAKAFRGELVPQDPADEPATALLDRIRAGRAAAPKVRRGRGAARHAEA